MKNILSFAMAGLLALVMASGQTPKGHTTGFFQSDRNERGASAKQHRNLSARSIDTVVSLWAARTGRRFLCGARRSGGRELDLNERGACLCVWGVCGLREGNRRAEAVSKPTGVKD